MWYVLSGIAVLLILGFLRHLLRLRETRAQIGRANVFLSDFIEWCDGQVASDAVYSRVLGQADVVQRMLGPIGRSTFRRPYETTYHQNYPIIINAVTEIRRGVGEEHKYKFLAGLQQMAEDSVVRFIGIKEDEMEKQKRRRWHPLVLFCGGIAWCLELPLFILSETNVISADSRTIIVNGKAFSVLAAAGTCLAMFAATITIVTGWERFFKILAAWIK